MNLINVLIKDGDRIINWDFLANTNLAYILGRFAFKPVPGSVTAGGQQIPDDRLNKTTLAQCTQEIAPTGEQMRVVITLKSVKPPAKPKPPVEGEIIPFKPISLEETANVC